MKRVRVVAAVVTRELYSGLASSWALRYHSTPPEDVRRNDQLVQIGLRVEL